MQGDPVIISRSQGTSPVEFTLAGKTYRINPRDVPRKLRGSHPEVIRVHAARVGGTFYPVKQVVSHLTGIPKADFNSHQAKQIVKRLGIPVVTAATGE